jgi:chemotaxis protein MotA
MTGWRGPRRATEFGSVLALPLAIGVVLAAHGLHGGVLRSLLDPAAGLIVLGGTLAATLITYSPMAVLGAVRAAGAAFGGPRHDTTTFTSELVALAIRAHRHGVVALDSELERIRDPFLRNGLTLAIDGATPESLRDIMAAEKRAREADDELPARIVETAAGYAPTLGIIGAVLGLIQVLEHLNAPGALGSGIAVAFVATFYGVGLANLVLLPVAGRLRERAAEASYRRDVTLEALAAVQQRVNPRLVAQRMRAFAPAMPAIEDIAARMRQRRTGYAELAS